MPSSRGAPGGPGREGCAAAGRPGPPAGPWPALGAQRPTPWQQAASDGLPSGARCGWYSRRRFRRRCRRRHRLLVSCPCPWPCPLATGPAAAPSLSDAEDDRPSTSGRPSAPQSPPPGPGPLRQAYKRLLRSLANLKLAIGELAVIAALSAVGTVIPQGEQYSYYAQVGAPPLYRYGLRRSMARCRG